MLTRQKYYYLLPIISLLFLTACGEVEKTTSSGQPENSQQETTTVNSSNSSEATQQLAIDPHKCTGCGKCARFDAEHFLLVSGISTVISQDNLDSKNLTTAISLCPEDAIELS